MPRQRRYSLWVALERNAAIGEAPLFPAPRRAGRSWTRHHAKDLLERAEAAAELPPLDGSGFHAYQPRVGDGAEASPAERRGRSRRVADHDTLVRCYTQTDEVTMLAVVSETRKVRAAGAKP